MLRSVSKAVYTQSRRAVVTGALPSRSFAAGAGLVELKTKQEYEEFPREKSVMYFTAKWCPPCRRIGPFFEELSEETPAVSFAKIDIDDNPDAAGMASIMSVPTFKFFKDGNEVEAIAGADATAIEQAVAKLAES